MIPPTNVMPSATAAMFERLRSEPLLQSFTLIGGTALSLHIGHRISEDLDFITTADQLPREVLKRLWQDLEKEGHEIVTVSSNAAYDDFQNAGLDLLDYSQNWVVDGDVKMTFFAAETQHKKILGKSGGDGAFAVGSTTEIAQLKALVAACRSKSRDWLDLYILERDYEFGLVGWTEAFKQAGVGQLQFEIALNRITSGKVQEGDEGYRMLLEEPPTIEEIRDRFRLLRDNFERDLANRAFGGS